jgi:hypothetical protein
MGNYKGTKVYATKKEAAESLRLWKKAVFIGLNLEVMGTDDALDALDLAIKYHEAIALKHRLPKINGYYGLSTKTREFLVAVKSKT